MQGGDRYFVDFLPFSTLTLCFPPFPFFIVFVSSFLSLSYFLFLSLSPTPIAPSRAAGLEYLLPLDPIAPSQAAGLEYLVPQTDRPKPRRRPREPTPNRQTTLAFPSDEAFLPLSLCLSLGPIE